MNESKMFANKQEMPKEENPNYESIKDFNAAELAKYVVDSSAHLERQDPQIF